MPKYYAAVGINYEKDGGEVRLDPGSLVPASLIKSDPWLVEQGAVAVQVDDSPPTVLAPPPAEPVEAPPADPGPEVAA